ncbi:MAG: DUF4180 domain-containing protein [Bacteroidales bacterium]|nr:DUF4180 domain-containing protein [Bacteroidales bacterium]
MIKYHRTSDNIIIAELTDDNFIISHAQDVLDIMGDIGTNGCNRIVFHEKNLHKDFFRLSTGLAGEILQKFSNYHFKLAIVGDFSQYHSKSMRDFIFESNKGNRIFFVENMDSALLKLK